MTIEAWNILLSAAILALLTGGGLWLKYVVDQQLKFKDTAIEALEGVVKLKDAHIATLEDNTAPAIVEAYAKMRQHANIMTDESQKLSARTIFWRRTFGRCFSRMERHLTLSFHPMISQ